MESDRELARRRFLAGAAAGVGGSLTGCLGTVLGGHGGEHTHLDVDLEAPASSYPYPAHGTQLPDVALPAPLSDTSVTLTQFEDRDVVLSFFYSHCQGICSRVISAMRNMQTRAAQDGNGDRVVFLAITFDPERDTPDRLREYADLMHVDLSLGNWYFLRPPSVDRAKAVVQEQFGFFFTRQWHTPTPTSVPGEDTATPTAGGTSTPPSTPTPYPTATNPPNANVTTPRSEGRYGFTHPALILLANQDAYVEKSYREGHPVWQTIYDDLETLWHREG
ncbi:MAG: SCO family protein [Haloarculaceae archaeon]